MAGLNAWNRPAPLLLPLAGLAAAAWIAWLCVGINLERGCAVEDTPYLGLCGNPPAGAAAAAALRARIAGNPGDANAYVRLAVLERAVSTPHVLAAAAALAPVNPSVLLLQASAALAQQNWAQAAAPLVQLSNRGDTSQADTVLATMVAGGRGDLLVPYLTPGSRWLPLVLAQVPPRSFTMALPLVVEGLRQGLLPPDSVLSYVRQLKAAGAWADAYSLWLAVQARPLPSLYNGDFDVPFQPDGFDWEVTAAGRPARAGAIVERRLEDGRGAILDVRFTGREMVTPLVRQYLFVGPGRYRLRGNFMSRQLRMEQGMAWAVRCAPARPLPIARTQPLGDTTGHWLPFTLEFSVPADCGLVASLQLETTEPVEAALGVRGRMAFDHFSLEKITP